MSSVASGAVSGGRAVSMSADKKKMMMLAGLAVVLLVVVGVRLLGSEGASSSSGSVPKGVDGRPVSLVDRDPQHLATVAKIARARVGAAYEGARYRDPMVSLVRDKKPAQTGSRVEEKPAQIELPEMSLYGIIWDPTNPIALIDGLELHVGDRIKSSTVVEIGIDRVVLAYRSRRFVLTVE